MASSSFPWRQGDAEVGVGHGVVGLEPDRLAVFGDGLVELPLGIRAMPRLLWAPASSGLSRIASRDSATASSSFPLLSAGHCRGMEWAVGVVGLEPDRLAEFGHGLVELRPGHPVRAEDGRGHGTLPGRMATAAVRCRTASSASGKPVAQKTRSLHRGAGQLEMDPEVARVAARPSAGPARPARRRRSRT